MRKYNRSKNKRVSKSQTQTDHAKRRCLERFGFTPTDQDFLNWISKIRKRQTTLFKKQSNRVYIFDLDHNGHELRLVYDMHRRTICSILDRTMDGVEIEEEEDQDEFDWGF